MAALRLGRRSDMDMTSGPIVRQIIMFSLPLLFGSLFQQLYNTVDTWVVGNFVGKNSFSAVGTLSSATNLIISFFMGFSNGASVIISHYFGAKDSASVNRASHTFMAVTLILCVALTIIGIAIIPLLLQIMKSPAEVAAEQKIYLTIYFAGISGLLIYNMGSAILRAIGDSTHPFIFLVVSASLNIVLDLVFVIFFDMGTAGVAYATIIAQGISALLVLRVLFTTDTSIRISVRKIKIDTMILGKIFKVGMPSALQMAITCFSNIFVQSYINFFGADVMGGWTSYIKVDQLVLLPMQSIAMATQTFVGQNLGTMNTERARQGVRTSLNMSLISTAVLIAAVIPLARFIVEIFIGSEEPGVILYGTMFLTYLTPAYLLPCFNQIYAGALRGCGKSGIPMAAMLLSFVAFRQVYLFIMANYISNTIMPIAMGYPAGWLVCSLILIVAYKRNFTDEKLKASSLV
ncbi:MAG: MATE family efflux transporter [Spirochaetales bacterium]|nr:MATE family efflux transporter [Spirochaetales bacterium]MBQ3727989.1 MATE family efflux transporter [Spirochaetales bacterium]MBR6235031.1 MATE family efflux transporter [Spirochaetales bacterium]